MTQLSPTSIGRLTGELIEGGFVSEAGMGSSLGLGRKATLIQINENRLLAVGVSIDKGIIRTGIVNIMGELLFQQEKLINSSVQQEELLAIVTELLQSTLKQCREVYDVDAIGVGISVPGPVVWPDGIMQYSPQFRWGHFDIRRKLQENLGRSDVLVENNVKAMAVAEHLFGDMKENPDFIVMNVGSGIGAAVISKGKLSRGAKNFLGEIGHTIVDVNGPVCDCGRRGCFQTYVSMDYVEKHFDLPFYEVIKRSRDGDAAVNKFLQVIIERFAIMTANLVNYYDIKSVVYEGKMQREWPEMVDMIKNRATSLLWHDLQADLDVVAADIKSEMISAAAVVFNEFWSTDRME
ncbi:MAG: ROK family protein [Lachnospiraceae bacterium]|nr:ROK family protein [Lachnospiraceae bacterium]